MSKVKNPAITGSYEALMRQAPAKSKSASPDPYSVHGDLGTNKSAVAQKEPGVEMMI